MRRVIGRGGAALLLVWTSVAGARDYYLAPDGNDEGPGNRENPWRSIARANAALGPGDRAVFLPGVYAGSISPARSGEPGKPVTYLAEKPGSVRIEGTLNPLYNEKVLIGIQDRRHLVVDGFANAGPGAKWLRLDRVHDSVFRNLRFDGTDFHNPIECRDSHRNRFRNIYAGRVLATQDGLIQNDLWNNFQCSYNVYEALYITRAGHRPFGIWYDSGHNVIRDCVFDAQWSRGFELFAPQRVLMERCLIVNAFRGTASAMSMAKIFMVDSIFRRNVVLRNGGAPLEARAYQYNDGVTVLPPFGLRGSRIYHNTFFRNLEHALVFGNGLSPELPDLTLDNEFKNNIFAENSPGGDGTALRILERLPAGNRICRNLIWGGPGQPHTVRFYNPSGAVTEALSTPEAEVRYPELFARNLDADPLFVDRERDDLRLRPESPALDAGEPLTVVASDGRGRAVPVRDARYFFDGFGIAGESGDLIRIGADPQCFRVVRADLVRNVLELDRETAFSAGEPVNLPYTGKAPDLGAYEAEMETAPQVPSELCLRPEEGEVLLHCDFEPENRESWFYRILQHLYALYCSARGQRNRLRLRRAVIVHCGGAGYAGDGRGVPVCVSGSAVLESRRASGGVVRLPHSAWSPGGRDAGVLRRRATGTVGDLSGRFARIPGAGRRGTSGSGAAPGRRLLAYGDGGSARIDAAVARRAPDQTVAFHHRGQRPTRRPVLGGRFSNPAGEGRCRNG